MKKVVLLVVSVVVLFNLFNVIDRLIDSYNNTHVTVIEAERYAQDLEANPNLIGD